MYPTRREDGDPVQLAEKMTQTDLFHNGIKVNIKCTDFLVVKVLYCLGCET